MENKDAINAITEIRDMMAKSSKVLSLSGMSSIVVGICAVISAAIAYWLINCSGFSQPMVTKILVVGGVVLVINCLIIGALFARRKARKNNLPYTLDATTRKMLWNFFLPLIIGGLFCLVLISKGVYGYSSSIMLIFYGISLINISANTYSSIQYLGYAELLIAFADLITGSYGLIFWAIGFGVGHIVYGILFCLLIERKKQ